MTTAVETMQDMPFTIGGRSFHSRLMVGTGKYRDNDTMARAIEASGAEIVTVAVRRVDLDRTKEEGVLYHLDAKRYFLLARSEEHTSELQSRFDLVCRLLLEKKKIAIHNYMSMRAIERIRHFPRVTGRFVK